MLDQFFFVCLFVFLDFGSVLFCFALCCCFLFSLVRILNFCLYFRLLDLGGVLESRLCDIPGYF